MAAKAKMKTKKKLKAADTAPKESPFLDHRRRFALVTYLVEQRNMLNNLCSELFQHNKLGKALGESRAKNVQQCIRDAMENLQSAADECADNILPSLEYYLLDLDD
jgi:hypothetical protein